jgi:hydroxypyruvate isomerase
LSERTAKAAKGRFAANLGFLWTDLPVLDRIIAAGAAGFGAVEFHWPYDVDPMQLRTAAANAGVALLGVNSRPGRLDRGELGFASQADAVPAFRESVEEALDYCHRSGATAVHVMAGMIGDGVPATARAVFVDNLRWAAGLAGEAGLALYIEPLNAIDQPGYFLTDIDQAAALIDDIGSPVVSIQFDSYHVARQGHDVVAAFARHRSRIGHVQIASFPDRAEPDHGSVDHRVFVRTAIRLGYDGWVAGEYRPRADVESGLGWLVAMKAT